MENAKIDKRDIFQYTYYDDNHKLIATLNVEKLKEILDVDEIELKENYMLTR